MLYTGRGKTKEVEQGKDLSGQLHSGGFLAAPVMPVSWKYIRKKTTDKNKKKTLGNCCLIGSLIGCGCADPILLPERNADSRNLCFCCDRVIDFGADSVWETRTFTKQFVAFRYNGITCRTVSIDSCKACGIVLYDWDFTASVSCERNKGAVSYETGAADAV